MKTPLLAVTLPLLLAGIFSSCNYFQNVTLLTQGRPQERNFHETFPFHFERGLIILDVQVSDDPATYPFLFDTGAFNSKISAELAGPLGLPVKAIKENSDSQGNVRTIEVVQIDSLNLGNLTFLNIGAGKIDWDSAVPTPCLAEGGILGGNLIKLANWQIDFATQTITASSEPFSVSEEAIRLRFTHPTLSGTPELVLEVDGRDLSPVLLDLGSNGSLRLPHSIHDAFDDTPGLSLIDATSAGIYGTSVDSVMIRPLPITLGEDRFTAPVRFEGSGEGLLGTEILQHYRVTIHYGKDEIFLEPYGDLPTAEPSLRFIPKVLNDEYWQVARTEVGSDFTLGDTLRSINGLQPKDLFATYCEYFMGIGSLLQSEESLRVEKLNGEIVVLDPIKRW